MKINKILICSILSLLMLSSCIKDNGNYEYSEMKKIYVGFEFNSYNVTAGESIDIVPVLKYKLEDKTEADVEVSYEWTIKGKIVGTDRILKYKAGDILERFPITLKITVDKTKEVYAGKVYMLIEPLLKYGITILHENENGETDLSFIRAVKTEKTINGTKYYELNFTKEYKDLYSKANGFSLGLNPVSIREHASINESNPDLHTELTVVTENGARMEDIHGFTMKRETRVEQEFSSGTPTDFVSKQVVHTNWDSYLIAEDGWMYSRRNADGSSYHTGTYNKDMKYYDAKYSDIFFTPYWRSNALIAIEYDKKNPTVRNYIGILCDNHSNKYNGMRLTIKDKEDPLLLEGIHNVKGEVICSDFDLIDIDENVSMRILMNIDSKYYIHLIGIDYKGKGADMEVYENKMVDLTPFNNGKQVLGLVTNKVAPCAYYWDDSKIYAYNWSNDTNSELLAAQGKKIVSVALHSQISSFDAEKFTSIAPVLIVAYDDGSIEAFDIKHDKPNEIKRSIFKSANKYGKIKQVIYKIGTVSDFHI